MSNPDVSIRKTIVLATICLGLVLMLAASPVLGYTDAELQAMQAALNQYLIDTDRHYSADHVYGLGEEFSEDVMRKARLKFDLARKTKSTTPIGFSSSEMGLIMCRFKGYFEHCSHPFAGDNSLTDVEPPYHIDFVISDSPVQIPGDHDVQNFPLFVLGIAPYFNLPGISQLILDRLTVAKIFRGCTTEPECLPGSITHWNDSAIRGTNDPSIYPLLEAAGEIKVFIQLDDAASTLAFRRALSTFDPDFSTQIGFDQSSEWTGTSHQKRQGAHGVFKGVKTTPGSIGFGPVNIVDELDGVVEHVEIMSANGKYHVHPESEELEAAFSEIGLAFGNDGTGSGNLTIDITGTLGERTWPISGIGYLAVRLDEHSSECLNKREQLVQFLEFLYKQEGLATTVFTAGFAPLDRKSGLQVLELIRSKLKCNGELVYQYPPPKPKVTLQADDSLHAILEIIGEDFAEREQVDLTITNVNSYTQLKKQFLCLGSVSCTDYTGGLVVLADENLSNYIIRDDALESKYDLFAMPYAAMATGFIHNFCEHGDLECEYLYREPLVLDLEIAALILDEKIQWWNDSRIQGLNTDKVLPQKEIVVVAGPKSSTFHFDFVDVIRKAYVPTFSFSGGGQGEDMYLSSWIDVALTPFSMSFVPFNGTNKEGVQIVSLVNRQGEVVKPDTESIEACAKDTYDPDANVFFMSSSAHPSCWPLVQVYNIFMLKKTRDGFDAKLTQFLYKESVRVNQALYLNTGDVQRADNFTEDVTVLNTVGLGTLVDQRLPELDLTDVNFVRLEAITYFDGTSVLMVDHDLGLIPESLIIVMYALLTLELICFLGLGIWVIMHRNRKLIRNSSPVFMIQVLFGAALMASTVIPLAEQDDYLVARGMTEETIAQDNSELNAACVSQPVLFSLGFFITFSALFLKSWRLIRIFNNKKLKNLFLRDKQLLMYQLAVIIAVVVLNLVWAIRDPLVWRRFPIFVDTKQELVVASIGICYSRTGVAPAIPLLVGLLLVLAIGNYLSYLGRRIPTEFNESKWTAMAMVVTLEAFVIGIPILALANSQPVPGFIIKAFSSLLIPGATVGLVFVPKVAMAYGWGVIEGESNPWRFVKGDSGSGSNSASKKSHKDGGAPDSNNSKNIKSTITPSLNSLVDGKITVVNTSTASHVASHENKIGMQSANPFFSKEIMRLGRPASKKNNTVEPTSMSPKRQSKEFPGSPSSQTLTKILQDDPMRRRFRRYLGTLRMEENIRFWDSLVMFRVEPDAHRRYVSARAIIQTFVLDSSPLQVNLSSDTKTEIMHAFNSNDKELLGSIDFFNSASTELFEDLRQSDAFRIFLENDTFSHQDVFEHSKSDPTVLVESTAAAEVAPNASPT